MTRPLQIAAAATLALSSLLFAYYRISRIPHVRYASASDAAGVDPIDALISDPVWATRAVAVNSVSSLHDDDLVVGVVVSGRARAYPIRILEGYEHVNDFIAGEPVCASW